MSKLHDRLKSWLLPGFRTGHSRYVDHVKATFKDDCRWLDAGGGRRVFHDLYDGEVELVDRARSVIVCDMDSIALQDHVSVSNRMRCDLENLPIKTESQDFVTCGMVVEHLEDPQLCVKEFARVLDHGGTLIIHTVNWWGYATQLAIYSKIIPSSIRKRLIAWVTGRLEEDIYPTHYRFNTRRRVSHLLQQAGLDVSIQHINHPPLFRLLPIYAAELLYIRLTSLKALRGLRGQLLITAKKP